MQELSRKQEYVCDRECGVWCPTSTLDTMLDPTVTLRAEASSGQQLCLLRCPECRHDMEHRIATEPGIELVHHCCPVHGAWIERGSLDTLQKLTVAYAKREVAAIIAANKDLL